MSEYYQKKFKFIIEDEAQDSSEIQQEFIKIISAKYDNIIRCGDVNQAILGTFSNSDVQGFKEFIAKNRKIEMFRSQRCAKNIYNLANALVETSIANPVIQNAFYNIKIDEVKGKNPVSDEIVVYDDFENSNDEKEFILNDIRQKLANNQSTPSFAILLRTNKQVASWAAFIEQQGLKVICRGDSYRQKKVFNFLLCALELFLEPWNNRIAAKFYREYCNIDKMSFDQDIFNYIEKNGTEFLHPDFLKNSDIKNHNLEIFWWEAFSIAESKTLNIQEIVISCASRYFDDVTDKSNAYLFSILIKRYINSISADDKLCLNYIPDVIKYLKNLLSQRTLKGINLFAKEDDDEDMNGFVQIMTIHKAKGAEFDYVYMPEFNDFNYSLNFATSAERIKKHKKPLLTKLDKIIFGKDISVSKVAKEEIEETLRLIYVAITRAKIGLKFTYSKTNDFKGKNHPVGSIKKLLNF